MNNIEEVYNHYAKEIYYYLVYLSKDTNLAEELTQETFFKILKNIDTFKGECHIKVWILRIAKNTYLSYLKKAKKYSYEMDTHQKVEESTIEHEIIKKQTVLELHKKLHMLDEPYKEVFTLRVFCELKFIQIGQLFGKTESWARVTYYRAKQRLREDIE